MAGIKHVVQQCRNKTVNTNDIFIIVSGNVVLLIATKFWESWSVSFVNEEGVLVSWGSTLAPALLLPSFAFIWSRRLNSKNPEIRSTSGQTRDQPLSVHGHV
jgi:hypothetical protein